MDTRKVTFIATIAAIILVAVGIGYAYTAMTTNSGNDSELKYLLMVPTDGTGTDSYVGDFDDAKITYSNVTHKVTEEEIEAGTYTTYKDGSPISAGHEIVIFSLDTTFGTGLPGGGAIKVGEIYLQIDEKNNVGTDQYYVKVSGNEGNDAYLDTGDFYFIVGFQVDQTIGASSSAPVNQAAIQSSTIFFDGATPKIPISSEVKPYVKGSGAVSAAITSAGTGFTVVKVTLWIAGTTGALADQILPLASAYEGTGLTEPLTDVKLTFKAIKPEVVATDFTITATPSASIAVDGTTELSVSDFTEGTTITDVTYAVKSGSEAKVSVDQNGVVKGIAAGTGTITVTCATGYSKDIAITVA